jgi:D-3-phosphoglycerate dehydrogenase
MLSVYGTALLRGIQDASGPVPGAIPLRQLLTIIYGDYMKIIITDGITPEGAKILTEAGHQVDILTLKPEELLNKIGGYDCIVVRSATKVTKEVIEAGKDLKIIARGGVGLDNIDQVTAKEKGIKVLNTPQASSVSVAELALAHMLALSRFLYVSSAEMKQGKWPKKEFSKGIELYKKNLGVLGFGNIGKEVAKRGIAFGMNVMAYDPMYSAMNFMVEITTKEKVIANADFLTLHLPLDKKNGATIGKKEFDIMKKGVVVINCARGGVVDEAALLEALNNGKVAAAGLDVFMNEPPTEAQKALIEHPRVSVTPHIGASTAEAQERVGAEIASRINAAFAEMHA